MRRTFDLLKTRYNRVYLTDYSNRPGTSLTSDDGFNLMSQKKQHEKITQYLQKAKENMEEAIKKANKTNMEVQTQGNVLLAQYDEVISY